MAQSRRRERELARRRFERRRMAEMQRREQRRRRNTMIFSVVGVLVVLGIVIGLGVVFLGGGSKSKTNPAASTSPSASTSASTSASSAAGPTKCATIKPDPPASGEPDIPQVTGKPPTKLVSNDITVGSGTEAKAGDTVTVKYVGVACSTGKVFDASYTDGAKNQEFSFTLGKGQVIPGWDNGVAGMKVGGVRQLLIPPDQAYGAAGSPPAIGPNEVLNFVVTLDKVSGS